MSARLERLKAALRAALEAQLVSLDDALDEVTIVLKAADYAQGMRLLRDHPELRFETLIDLCGVDYSGYGGDGSWAGGPFPDNGLPVADTCYALLFLRRANPAEGLTPTLKRLFGEKDKTDP